MVSTEPEASPASLKRQVSVDPLKLADEAFLMKCGLPLAAGAAAGTAASAATAATAAAVDRTDFMVLPSERPPMAVGAPLVWTRAPRPLKRDPDPATSPPPSSRLVAAA